MVTVTPGLSRFQQPTSLPVPTTGQSASWKAGSASPYQDARFPLPALTLPGQNATPKNISPKYPAETQQKALIHLGKAGALITGALLLKRLPKRESSFRLFSTDWKEWAKVFLAIGGLGEAQKAAHWQPPVWASAMLNVAVVTPLVTKFHLSNIMQGIILSPLVGGLAGLNHYLSDKAEQPAQEFLHLPATATRIILSALTTLTGLAILPTVGKAIPQPAKNWPGQSSIQNASTAETATRAGVGTICANGCCASLICANDVGQMGSAMLNSYQTHRKEQGLTEGLTA